MNRIKMLREELNMTQQELADKLEGAKSTVAMYENETRKPSYEVLIKLSNIFNCSIDYIMGLTTYINPKEDLEKELYKLNLTEDEFNEMISLLTDENNKNLNTVLQSTTNLAQACDKCLDLILDYSDENNTVLYKNINKLTNIIKSLDKSKIIHNYNAEQDTPEIRAIARDVAKLKPEKKELFKKLLKEMSDEADEANKK